MQNASQDAAQFAAGLAGCYSVASLVRVRAFARSLVAGLSCSLFSIAHAAQCVLLRLVYIYRERVHPASAYVSVW